MNSSICSIYHQRQNLDHMFCGFFKAQMFPAAWQHEKNSERKPDDLDLSPFTVFVIESKSAMEKKEC